HPILAPPFTLLPTFAFLWPWRKAVVLPPSIPPSLPPSLTPPDTRHQSGCSGARANRKENEGEGRGESVGKWMLLTDFDFFNVTHVHTKRRLRVVGSGRRGKEKI
ncbi:hypothetical protein Naga_103314g1, partial [Nannochloropsis gaditana]